MKSVLISIQPKWCELIANGKKTIEVRKTRPKLETPFKCYIYQTKKRWIYKLLKKLGLYQGKVIGEFVCDKIIPVMAFCSEPNAITPCELPFVCLTENEIIDYLGNGKEGYGWHISDLKIYDKPKELGEFKKYSLVENDCWYKQMGLKKMDCAECKHCLITRPPQSYCFVEEL